MHIDQKHVTAISLHDGRTRDMILRKDAWGYQLSLISKDEVVNIQLSIQDLQKLRQELAKWDSKEFKKECSAISNDHPIPVMAEPPTMEWSTLDWISFN